MSGQSEPSEYSEPEYTYAAGVLFYAFFNDCLYFLLGKSKRSSRLTTFCGKGQEGETAAVTAAREAYEETLGCVLCHESLTQRVTNCTLVLNSTTPRGLPCYTYVVEINFRKNYCSMFHSTRDFLLHEGLRSHIHFEMTDIKWLCARNFFHSVKQQWVTSGMLVAEEEWQRLSKLNRSTEDRTSWRQDPEGT